MQDMYRVRGVVISWSTPMDMTPRITKYLSPGAAWWRTLKLAEAVTVMCPDAKVIPLKLELKITNVNVKIQKHSLFLLM